MGDRYGTVVTTETKTGEIVAFSVVDTTAYPEDPKTFMQHEVDWYRKKMLESFKIVTFPVSVRQTEQEARRRTIEYLDFMNRQDDAIQVAAKLIGI